VKRKLRPNGKFVTLRDAEREYGIAYHMLYAWVMEGRLPRLEAAGRAILIKRADLDAFLESNMTPAVRS
jgi:excisionase family DNA binding protein